MQMKNSFLGIRIPPSYREILPVFGPLHHFIAGMA